MEQAWMKSLFACMLFPFEGVGPIWGNNVKGNWWNYGSVEGKDYFVTYESGL